MSKLSGRAIPLLPTLQRYQGLAGMLLLCAAAGLWEPAFFSSQNAQNVLNQVAIPGTLAIGMTFVILTGGIDLSVGSQLALFACIAATWLRSGASLPVTIAYVLGLSTILGGSIGALIGWTRMQPFVVTLAAMVSVRGVTFLYTRSNVSGIGEAIRPLQQAPLGLPVAGWILLVLALATGLVLAKTVLGRQVYALGGNEQAARLAGVRTGRVRTSAYAINGLCVGLAALLFVARNNSAEPGGAIGYELDAIAAVVVGGSSLLGGYGNMMGTLVGALFITCMNVLLNLKGVDDKLGLGLKGPILLVAVYLQNLGRR